MNHLSLHYPTAIQVLAIYTGAMQNSVLLLSSSMVVLVTHNNLHHTHTHTHTDDDLKLYACPSVKTVYTHQLPYVGVPTFKHTLTSGVCYVGNLTAE